MTEKIDADIDADVDIDIERSVGDLVKDVPQFSRVFESVGIDYCCGGDASLEQACEENGLDVSDVRKRLIQVRRRGDGINEELESMSDDEWDSPSNLVQHIVSTHHDYLRDELPALGQLVNKVARVHGDNHPRLDDVEKEFLELADEMREHTKEEETEVFPVIENLESGEDLSESEVETLHEEIESLEDDHEEAAKHLERIEKLTDGYTTPEDACPSYRSMLDRLEHLEQDTHRHVHKENNVLFPTVEEAL
ncbi:MAG: iron-sulfur cluster repair di-iron protein [Halobacteria archaeon]|nr:iron-sulfur cluster repair di-iron protein [Halobacteria archaeon]